MMNNNQSLKIDHFHEIIIIKTRNGNNLISKAKVMQD